MQEGAICRTIRTLGADCDSTIVSIDLRALLIVLAVAGAVIVIVGAVRLLRPNKSEGITVSCPYAALNAASTMRMHPDTMAKMLNMVIPDDKKSKSSRANYIIKRYGTKYHKIKFYENDDYLFQAELKIEPWPHKINEDEIRLDNVTLDRLKMKSESDNDDGTDATTGADGRFTFESEPFIWYDVWNWINHPNRETRWSVRVALAIAAIEFLPEIVNALV